MMPGDGIHDEQKMKCDKCDRWAFGRCTLRDLSSAAMGTSHEIDSDLTKRFITRT